MVPELLKAQAEASFTAILDVLRRMHLGFERSFPPGTELVHQGCAVEQFYLLVQGVSKMTHINSGGRELTIGLQFGASLIGAAYVALESACPLTVTTVTRCCVYLVRSARITQLLRARPEFAFHVSRLLACESAECTRALMEVESATARHRLVEMLKSLGGSSQLPSQIGARPSARLRSYEMAELLAITPEHFSRLVRSLRREGVLVKGRRTIALDDATRARSEPVSVGKPGVWSLNLSNGDLWVQKQAGTDQRKSK